MARSASGKRGQALAVVFDELAHHALLAQHLGHRQDQVGGRCAFGKRTRQLEADDLGNQHRHRLTEHRRLGLDAADAPAQNTQPVDHRGVGIGPEQRIGIRQRLLARRTGRGEDDPGQILQVDLVDDSGIGRNDLEILEGILAPAEERVPLTVAAELEVGVDRECRDAPRLVHLHRMVNHKLDRLQGIDLSGLPPHLPHRIPHRGQVDHGGHPREVLQQDAAGAEGDLPIGLRPRVPCGQTADVVGRDRRSIFVAQQVLQQHLEGERQSRHVKPLRAQGVEPVIVVGLPIDGEGRQRFERLGHGSSLRAGGRGLKPIQARINPRSLRA